MNFKNILIFKIILFFFLAYFNLVKAEENSFLRSGTISGRCFNDLNQNGSLDYGDKGIAGVTVSLKRLHLFVFPIEIRKLKTGADGGYEFKGLRKGVYIIEAFFSAGEENKTRNPSWTFLGIFINHRTINFGIQKEQEKEISVSVAIDAEPQSIEKGEASILKWTSVGADKVIIDQGIGEVYQRISNEGNQTRKTAYTINNDRQSNEAIPDSIIGRIEVSPTETKTYNITAEGEDNTTAHDSVTVIVMADNPATPPPQTTTTTTIRSTGGSGGSGSGGSSGSASTTTTDGQANECEEDDTAALDISGGSGGYHSTVTHIVRVQNAPHHVQALGFEVTYDNSHLQYTNYMAGNCLTDPEILECSEPLAGLISCKASGEGEDIIFQGDRCRVVDLDFIMHSSRCESETCPSELRLQSLHDDIADWSTSHGCFCCPQSCNDSETRACYHQNGVCAGSVEECNEAAWPGCDYRLIPGYEFTESLCNDGLDNDCDNLTDCRDPDCDNSSDCENICDDGLDNDADGLFDCEDPDCEGVAFDRCYTGEPGVCDNGTNQCFGGQIICMRNTEPTDEVCDGLDNDCDSVVDEGFNIGEPCMAGLGQCMQEGVTVCSDNGTSTVCDALPGDLVVELCDDEQDNDCDGLTDCSDPHCFADPTCNMSPITHILSPSHGLHFDENVPITFNGTADDPEEGLLPGDSLSWSSSLDGEIGTGPAVVVNSLSAGIHTIELTATDSQGAQGTDTISIAIGMFHGRVWQFDTGGYVFSTPTVSSGYVYVGSYLQDVSSVFCLNAQTGHLIWEFQTGYWVYSSPVVSGGNVYVGSGDRKLYCLNAQNGSLVWEFETGNMVNSSPAVSGGYVYVGSGDHKLYCLSAQDGRLVWEFQTGDWVHSTPAVSNGYVYVGSNDSKLYCLNAQTGSLIWEFQTGHWVKSSPTVWGGNVYVGSDDYKVYCLNAQTGSLVWNFETEGCVDSSPAVSDGYVYVGSSDHKLYCLDAQTGDNIWEFVAANDMSIAPALSGGYVYVGCEEIVNCLNMNTGALVWDYELGGTVFSSPVVSGGYVYVGSWDRNVYCLTAGAGDPGTWPMFKGNPERTGTQ